MVVGTISVYGSLNVVLFSTASSTVMCSRESFTSIILKKKFLTLLQRRAAGCMYVRILSLGKGIF